MTKSNKNILRALAGETLKTPPIWVMRQAGRYLPEYRKLRAKAGDFLSLCYNSELAAEVTLQPIERFKLDAAIIFADILLIPQALGSELSFLEGDGPRLSRISNKNDILKLKPAQLPPKVALIGFAGAPWTVATYMIAGKGTKDQGPAHKFLKEDKDSFEMLINLLTEATILYLSKQIDAGAEVIKIFDSWAGSLKGEDFVNYAIIPIKKIITALNKLHPDVPIIAFPREAGLKYIDFANETGADCIAIDHSVDPEWAAKNLQIDSCIQGNLNPKHMVTGGKALLQETTKILDCFSNGPHIFNLGHGITPDGKPENLQLMIDKIRSN